ncbi:MAG: hypothetical protein E3J72_19755 [Planctomycetota bacterium]|nr:MAG: hypothetical protein E3J72_19755 [Planctomycetota bacterium]
MGVHACAGCGADITDEDIIDGGPVKIRDQIYCGDCAERIRQKQAERAATAAGASAGAGPKAARRAGAPARGGRPGTARRTRTGARKRPKTGVRRSRREEEDEYEDEYFDEEKKSNLPLILGLGGGGLVLLIIIVVAVVMSGGDEEQAYEEFEEVVVRDTQPVDRGPSRTDQANSEWNRLQNEIEKLKARNEYGKALAKLNAFMNKWSGTSAARDARGMHEDLVKIKADWDLFEPFDKRARKKVFEKDYVGAMKEYAEFGKANLENYFLSNAAKGFRDAGKALPKLTGQAIPAFSGFDGSFLGIASWYVTNGEILGEGPGAVWSELPRSEEWLDYTVTMEINVGSGNPQFMVRGIETRRQGERGFEGAWKTIDEEILPHGQYVSFELKVSGDQWSMSVDGAEKDSATLPEEHSHSGTVAFRFEGDGTLRIRKLEVTIHKYK